MKTFTVLSWLAKLFFYLNSKINQKTTIWILNKYDRIVNKSPLFNRFESRVLTYSNKSMVLESAQRFIYGYVLVTGTCVCLLLIWFNDLLDFFLIIVISSLYIEIQHYCTPKYVIPKGNCVISSNKWWEPFSVRYSEKETSRPF